MWINPRLENVSEIYGKVFILLVPGDFQQPSKLFQYLMRVFSNNISLYFRLCFLITLNNFLLFAFVERLLYKFYMGFVDSILALFDFDSFYVKKKEIKLFEPSFVSTKDDVFVTFL